MKEALGFIVALIGLVSLPFAIAVGNQLAEGFGGVAGFVAGSAVLLIGLGIKEDAKKERKRRASRPVAVSCANCGYRCSSEKWIATGGCPRCGSDICS